MGHWFTGMCLAGRCTKEDFVPRNTSIFYDAVAPQMTDGQEAAVKALYATGTPEFWVAAAHANGIYGKDAEVASYAATQNDLTGNFCTRWNERESTWRKSWSCQSRGTSQSKS